MFVTIQYLGMSIKNMTKMKEFGITESTIKKIVKNRWIFFKKRRIGKNRF